MYAYIDTGMCVYMYYRQMYACLCMCKAYLYKMWLRTTATHSKTLKNAATH